MKPTVILGLLLTAIGPLLGQSETAEMRHTIYGGFVRQGILYIKYERSIFDQDWTQTIANMGFGGVPGESENGVPPLIYPSIWGWAGIFEKDGDDATRGYRVSDAEGWRPTASQTAIPIKSGELAERVVSPVA